MDKPQGIFGAGEEFFVGCNYWASHAGTEMWRNWREDIVEEDFRLLSENGVEVARVFPLWPDFQPLKVHATGHQQFAEMRMREEPLPDTPAGQAGIDPIMVERFRILCEIAARYKVKLIVGLVTGWMSGRMHVPPAFVGVNVHTDPMAVMWEVRMVRFLVKELKDCAAITAWDLGNECNCMSGVASPRDAWVWSNSITSAIRVEDPTRPVVSGMHSITCEKGNWLIVDQAEITDVLCTHPYPLFTPHCSLDPLNTMRNAFHAAAETRLYGDVGGVPSFVEEAGNLGPCQSSEEVAGHYMENMLWNSYAHDCRGLLWWCAHDQTELEQTPYDWLAVERELGLMRVDRTAKPTLQAMNDFRKMLDKVGLRTLPAFRRDAVCILTPDQDQWGVGYSSFILAKQAGFDIEFQYANQPLKDSNFYILPSISGQKGIPHRRYLELLAAVKEGATLLVTSDGGCIEPLAKVFGVDIAYHCRAVEKIAIRSDENEFDLSCAAEHLVKLSNRDAEVLAVDIDDDPVFTCRDYGMGRVLFLAAPIEYACTVTPRSFMPGAPEFYRLYKLAAERAGVERNVLRTNPSITLTEHDTDEETLLVVAVNNTPDAITDEITAAPGWAFDSVVWGGQPVGSGFSIPGNSGVILRFIRQG